MKKFLILLVLLLSSFLSYSQISELMKNNGIGLTKEQIAKSRNYPCDLYPDTLNGVEYNVLKCSSSRVLERFFLSNIENKKDTQICFYYRMTLVTGFFPVEKVENVLDVTFKRQKNHQWLQKKDSIDIIWTIQQKDYLLILNAQKQ